MLFIKRKVDELIKIRLHGEKEEIELACAAIEEQFKVLSISAPYADRGKSVYNRVYIDAEIRRGGDNE